MNTGSILDSHKLDFYEPATRELSEGIIWTDLKGLIIYASDSAKRWLWGGQSGSKYPGIQDCVVSGNLKEWLEELASKPKTGHAPIHVQLRSGVRALLYAMVNVSLGGTSYYCFLLKEEYDDEGDPNQMLRIISEGTSTVIGGDFFRSLAYYLIVSTGIRYALVTECANVAKTRVRTLVYIERDHFLDNFEYDLTGTPCEIVMKGENYYCTTDLDMFFPKEEGVKSYFGVPVFLSNGEVIGHIAIFDTKPITISEQKLNILKIFASRAGVEIERKRKDEIINSNMYQYKSIFDFSPVGMCEEDFSEVKKYTEGLREKHGTDLNTIFERYPEEIFNSWKRIKRIRVNRAQQEIFDVTTEDEYSAYMQETYMPTPAKALILTFENGTIIFEREVEITSRAGIRKMLKVKRIIMPEAEKDWSKSLISCIDITHLKIAESNLKKALDEVQLLKEKLEAENIYLQNEIKQDHNFDEIVSSGDAFRIVLEKISQVADTDATVLILGESGTGKELIARAIHSVSKRSMRPIVKVNCAALPANLIESELFGHEKGAFTGAITQKTGRFELADGGTLFLDEIGEMPLDLQSKLLRVLQEGEFERVGSSRTIKVDVRVIAATNRDLHASVVLKEFRADLYYRLNVFPILSPPLRDRREDIPLLVNHFCKKYGVKFGRKITSVSKPVLDTLIAYDWPGNVRELENIIERGIIVSKSNVLEQGDWLPVSPVAAQTHLPVKQTDIKADKTLEEIERQHIIDVLQGTNWKIRGEDGAARVLGLNPTTLEARMKKLGIVRTK